MSDTTPGDGATIAGLLDQEARVEPDRPFLKSDSGEIFTVGEVHGLVHAAADWLRRMGIGEHTTVAWQLPSTAQAAVLSLALPLVCRRQAPIIHIYRRREVAAALSAADAGVLIVDASTTDNTPQDTESVVLPPDWLTRLRRDYRDLTPRAGATSPSMKWIYFTSGSSGSPKAVAHTDTTLLVAARGFRAHLGLGNIADEVASIAFPIAHIGGLVMLISALLGRYCVVLLPKIDVDTFPALLARHDVTMTGGSPTHYQMLVAAQLAQRSRRPLVPSLRMLTGGGAACSPDLHRAVREHLGIPAVHSYGMTEAAMICVGKYADNEEQQINSSGAPVAGVDIRIANDGEIQVRGANVTPGYLDEQRWVEATTADGWFRTGDRGFLRADRRIVVTGRLKELIIRKGENIAPELIEQELSAHPHVAGVVVVGQPDALRGEIVCAVVQRSPRLPDVTLGELCAFLDQRGLMKQMWPERLVMVDEFPTTGLGKVARAELARQITAL